MTSFLEWLAQSGERITVVGLLLIILFVIVYGVQKKQRWWVPGWMLTDCEEERDELKEKLNGYVKRTEERLEDLERAARQGHEVTRRALELRDS